MPQMPGMLGMPGTATIPGIYILISTTINYYLLVVILLCLFINIYTFTVQFMCFAKQFLFLFFNKSP